MVELHARDGAGCRRSFVRVETHAILWSRDLSGTSPLGQVGDGEQESANDGMFSNILCLDVCDIACVCILFLAFAVSREQYSYDEPTILFYYYI